MERISWTHLSAILFNEASNKVFIALNVVLVHSVLAQTIQQSLPRRIKTCAGEPIGRVVTHVRDVLEPRRRGDLRLVELGFLALGGFRLGRSRRRRSLGFRFGWTKRIGERIKMLVSREKRMTRRSVPEDNLFRFSNFLYIVAASFSFGKENPIIDS